MRIDINGTVATIHSSLDFAAVQSVGTLAVSIVAPDNTTSQYVVSASGREGIGESFITFGHADNEGKASLNVDVASKEELTKNPNLRKFAALETAIGETLSKEIEAQKNIENVITVK